MFLKGHKKIGGRLSGSKNKVSQKLIDEFLDTLNEVALDNKISQGRRLIKHIICRAYKNDVVAISLLKKLIPDLSFNINELRSPEPVKVTFDIVDGTYSLKEEMINKNRANILGVLRRVGSGEIGPEEGFTRIGEELLN